MNDIAKDKAIFQELSFSRFGNYALTALDYINRAENAELALSHERRKVEAAIEFLHRSNCPPGYRDVMGGCEKLIALRAKHGFDCAEEARLCRKCWDDYLDQKAKEAAEKHGA